MFGGFAVFQTLGFLDFIEGEFIADPSVDKIYLQFSKAVITLRGTQEIFKVSFYVQLKAAGIFFHLNLVIFLKLKRQFIKNIASQLMGLSTKRYGILQCLSDRAERIRFL